MPRWRAAPLGRTNRAGKAVGGYCSAFHDTNQVVVFGNSVGSDDDVRLLTHEMGHAFQAWESQWIEAVVLRWPTADAAEVHSMGMEFLSLAHLGEFFSPEHHRRFTLGRWRRAIELLCHTCEGAGLRSPFEAVSIRELAELCKGCWVLLSE